MESDEGEEAVTVAWDDEDDDDIVPPVKVAVVLVEFVVGTWKFLEMSVELNAERPMSTLPRINAIIPNFITEDLYSAKI
jgi:hypothetical protein